MIPVILSGGSGTRLWPLSRSSYPKQFIGVTEERTMFQLTLARLAGLPDVQAPLVVGNENHRFILGEQLHAVGVKPHAILLEPVGRNTAPAIAAAAAAASAQGADPLLLVLAADHVIADTPAFHQAIAAGVAAAEAGALVTFGIVPTAPETGYGYIQVADRVEGISAVAVSAFVEKPDLETARRYLADGRHLWNSGMFLFKASVLLAELERFSPAVVKAARESVAQARSDLDFIRLDKEAFSASPEDSIDYAVMEKSDKVKVVPLSAGWSDVGAWGAVWDVATKDAEGNAARGDVWLQGVKNSYVRADHRLVAAIGLDNVMIVETSDAVLVASKESVQEVKKIVDRLKAAKRPEAALHREVFRPWGSYDSIDHAERYQVKRITVNPGQKLSVQMHHHRAEHWVVVSGTAKVWLGDKEVLLTENQSTYIPVGVVHALENPGKIPLELIEVQSGAYLGEDDIVRFEDRYGRA
ncbi:mannose-1-phosphate guanylyltransferase/mannose-6-phosphate isomerase [Xylophilus sp. GOD-11R]|uniref:mannose-1-phosphate guanylyltransferase/mannose-6-phosphate isomerase n=1 Tax=Xylophilus sp. GOD-11R TaxID=3089814 RepID=UPI00298BF981|nr:mannose-1-phosphate guanylyltransferase/mannose-6-phosphate isomerase [Xylophilus sp. GOD-11R]WPB58062.1 mannose-1-phosphate guanylyltransferase/mannose-6-phosphate isomerase [Xylophilus sp. GOD-11R]